MESRSRRLLHARGQRARHPVPLARPEELFHVGAVGKVGEAAAAVQQGVLRAHENHTHGGAGNGGQICGSLGAICYYVGAAFSSQHRRRDRAGRRNNCDGALLGLFTCGHGASGADKTVCSPCA